MKGRWRQMLLQGQNLSTAASHSSKELQDRPLFGSTGGGCEGFYLLINCSTCQTMPSQRQDSTGNPVWPQPQFKILPEQCWIPAGYGFGSYTAQGFHSPQAVLLCDRLWIFLDLNQLQTAILHKVNYTYLTHWKSIRSVKIFLVWYLLKKNKWSRKKNPKHQNQNGFWPWRFLCQCMDLFPTEKKKQHKKPKHTKIKPEGRQEGRQAGCWRELELAVENVAGECSWRMMVYMD